LLLKKVYKFIDEKGCIKQEAKIVATNIIVLKNLGNNSMLPKPTN
jgi:hypothetical protein